MENHFVKEIFVADIWIIVAKESKTVMKEEPLFLTLYDAGTMDYQGPFQWGPGIRDLYIIHFVVSGCGYFESAGKTYRLTAGQSFLIVPGVLIRYYPDRKDPWKYIWVNFSGMEARQLMENCSLSEKNPVADLVSDQLRALFLSTVSQFRTSTAAELCRSNGNLRLLLAYYLGTYPAGKSSGPDNFIRLLEFIENNLQQPELNINLLAARFNINRVSVYRWFKREFGFGPNRYILQLRIQKACELLARQDLSAKSIAFSSGFSDPLYLSRVFKQHTGFSPTQYREQLRRQKKLP